MEKKISILPIIVVSFILFGGIIGLALAAKKEISDADYSEFISCLAGKEAKLYVSSWCSFCAKQKTLFGEQQNQLTEKGVSVLCDATDGTGQAEECNEAGISGYPTWIIDNEMISGVQTLEFIAEKTECALPQPESEK
ncbi:hypothetical protein JW796_01810 [Candidatus Dojkabacteria bacterium]|nr:hypothetical protein [Candidatus Dojkabacteria bacterium]